MVPLLLRRRTRPQCIKCNLGPPGDHYSAFTCVYRVFFLPGFRLSAYVALGREGIYIGMGGAEPMSDSLSAAAVSRRRYFTFGMAGVILIVGQGLWPFHDALLLADLVLAGGLV